MRIIRHTPTQFAAEEKPLTWSVLFALFGIAALVLLASALTKASGWHIVAAALTFAVTGYILFSVERAWLILDREANLADLRIGRQSVLVSVDALMRAEVRNTPKGYALAIETAIRNEPVLLFSKDEDPAQLELCARQINAWLKGEVAATAARPDLPMLDSAPLLT